MTLDIAVDDHDFGSAMEKVRWRLLSVLTTLFFFAYVDRSNVAYAASSLEHDLGLSDAQYGLSAGIFFIAYAGFQVPANLLLVRLGPRCWLGLVTTMWSIMAASCGLVTAQWQFLLLRFGLGLAEAGLAPGVMMYLTCWFPPNQLTSSFARFFLAAPLSSVCAAPISEFIIGALGWRAMFVLEAVPVFFLGLFVLCWLPNRLEEVSWLSGLEKRALARHLPPPMQPQREATALKVVRRVVCGMPTTWGFGIIGLTSCMAIYGVQLWLPSIVENCVDQRWQISIGSALPYILAFIAMRCERAQGTTSRGTQKAAVAGFLLGSIFLVLAAVCAEVSTWFSYFAIAMSVPCCWFGMPPFLAHYANDFETRLGVGDSSGRSAGIAAVNCIAHVGAFVGPYVYGLFAPLSETYGLLALTLPVMLAFTAWPCVTRGLNWTTRIVDHSQLRPCS